MSDHILVRHDGPIATVVLNREKARNAITLGMYQRLPEVFTELDQDPGIKVLVLRGAGERAFASGADIGEFETVRANASDAKRYNEHVAAAEQALEAVSKPTIAMVHGYCIGGGCGLALACDLRFADSRAKFGITPAKLGLVYSLESTKRLVDAIGAARAKWVLMSGQQVGAAQAERWGLAELLGEPEELAEQTYEFAGLLAERAQYSVRATKQIVGRILSGQTVDDEETTWLRNSSFDTDDYAEGVRAFLEKRAPVFTWS
ncbi:MAG: enoyl-CoA hydratase [Pseudonocardiaceae bacterium]|nr:enoyl-CoA hydratase [Pseudonocardiaceae bacterium]